MKSLNDLLTKNATNPNLGTKERMKGFISVIAEETDDLLFFCIHQMSSFLKVPAPKLVDIKSAILNGGYRVSCSHTEPNSIKTNAPAKFVWAAVAQWVLVRLYLVLILGHYKWCLAGRGKRPFEENFRDLYTTFSLSLFSRPSTRNFFCTPHGSQTG